MSKQYLSRCWKSAVDGAAEGFVSAGVVGEANATVVNDVGKKPNRKYIENRNINIDRPKRAGRTTGKPKSAVEWD